MGGVWNRFLNWMVPPLENASRHADRRVDISTLDRMDGVGHKHKWQAHGTIFKCECGRRVPPL